MCKAQVNRWDLVFWNQKDTQEWLELEAVFLGSDNQPTQVFFRRGNSCLTGRKRVGNFETEFAWNLGEGTGRIRRNTDARWLHHVLGHVFLMFWPLQMPLHFGSKWVNVSVEMAIYRSSCQNWKKSSGLIWKNIWKHQCRPEKKKKHLQDTFQSPTQ